jgi:tetratricopeptide (TPR) repeat protein
MKRYFAFVVLVILSASIAGCGSASKKANPSASASSERAFHKRFDDPVLNLVVYNGWTHYHEGRYENALNDFERLMKTGNSHYDVSFGAGMSCFRMKNYRRAVSYFSRCLSQRDDHFEALYFRGESYRLSGDVSKSRSDFERIVSMDMFGDFLCGLLSDDRAGSALFAEVKADAAKKIGELK